MTSPAASNTLSWISYKFVETISSMKNKFDSELSKKSVQERQRIIEVAEALPKDLKTHKVSPKQFAEAAEMELNKPVYANNYKVQCEAVNLREIRNLVISLKGFEPNQVKCVLFPKIPIVPN